MQAKEKNMLEHLIGLSTARRGVRLLCVLGALGIALLLFLLANSLPPLAWRLLASLILLLVIVPRAYQLVFWLARHLAHLGSVPAQSRLPARATGAPAYLGTLPQSSAGRSDPFFSDLSLVSRSHLPIAPTVQVPATPQPALLPPPRPLSEAKAELASGGPTIQFVVSTGLDVGLKRKDRPNEDSLLAQQQSYMRHGARCPLGLFVIADGMGGHGNGQEASRLAIQSLNRSILPSIFAWPDDTNYAALLSESIAQANREIYERNRQDGADMGTTLAAALVVDTTAYIANAGDSRIYLYRASRGLVQVSRDHSTVARLVENGLITPEEVYTHPRRNEIYRSLGQQPSAELDLFILALQPSDLLVLCSDGLWEMVRDAQIRQIIESALPRPTRISAELVQAALAGGGKDNISVITVYLQGRKQTLLRSLEGDGTPAREGSTFCPSFCEHQKAGGYGKDEPRRCGSTIDTYIERC